MPTRSCSYDAMNVSRALDIQSITPADSAVNGEDISLKGYDEVLLVVHLGTSASTLDSSDYFTCVLQEADDSSGSAGTYSDVANADMRGAVGTDGTGAFAVIDAMTEDDATYKVAYLGNKPWVRVRIEPTGTDSGGCDFSGIALRGKAATQPVS